MTTSIHDPLVNGRYLTRSPTGVDRFAIEVVAALAQRQPAGSLHIAVPASAALPDAGAEARAGLRRVGRRRGHAWEQFDLPGAAADRALVNLCNTAPLWRERQLVVIHDAAAVANPANYGVAFRNWYRLMHAGIMRRARVVATVSKFSADELTKHYGRRRRGIEVIHESGAHILRQPADALIVERLGLAGRRYVLAVGSLSPNKNFASVLQAVAAQSDPGLLLVAAGGGDPRVFGATSLRGDQLRLAGYVSDAELRALYEHAVCFAFPSFYEGFGLPPLEAMCCGCPVIVSDRGALPEVCADAALYCRAEDAMTLADALRGLLASPARQQELRQAGFARARAFGWQRAAAQLEQILHESFR